MRVSRFLFWFWMGKRCCTLKSNCSYILMLHFLFNNFCHRTISVPKRQNPLPLLLVKLRNRALKFLVHFSLVCLGECPKLHEKWLPIGQGIWGSISHPSGMLWRPFRGHFLQILQPKGVFRSLFLCISCIYETSKPLPVAKEWQSQWEGVLTFRTLIVKPMGRCFQ